MSDILAYFAADQINATIERPTYTKVNDRKVPGTPISIGTVKALYWKGAMAESFVSERFKEQTAAAISVEVGTNIKAGDKVTVNSLDYQVIDVDNVGAAGEHLHVALGLFS